MEKQKSIRKELTFSESVYQRLEKLAIENGFITSSEAPNVSRYIREVIIKTHLDVERMEDMPDLQEKDRQNHTGYYQEFDISNNFRLLMEGEIDALDNHNRRGRIPPIN